MSDWLIAWLGRAARRIGVPTLLTLTLLAAAAGIYWVGTAAMVREARNIPGLVVVVVGLTLAWALARSSLRPAIVLGVGVLAGIGLILFSVGGLSLPLGTALGQFLTSIPGQSAWASVQAGLEVLVQGLLQLVMDSSVLLARLTGWLATLFRPETAIDPVAQVMFWTLVIWGGCFWAGFVMRRWRQPLLAVLPAGAVLAALSAYTQQAVIYPLLLVGIYLALQVLVSYFLRTEIWAREEVDAPELHLEVGLAAMGVPFLLTALAVMAPSLSIRSVVEWVQERPLPLQQEGAGQALGIERGPGGVSGFQSAAAPGLAREHLIGSGPELSEQPVLRASVTGTQAFSTSETGLPEDIPPLYWRLLTYDRYTGSGWATSEINETDLPAGAAWNGEETDQDRGWLVRQTVTKAGVNDVGLYTAGELLAASEPYRTAARSPQDLFGAQTDSQRYTADAILTSASADELKAAGSGYPEWVRSRYLQLPETISARVTRLALELTAREPTPYERAAAITRYLRTFPYTLDVPRPPRGREISDYFIFELQRGYCDYYATSMVVLARAAGLPARMVIGYASGTWEAASQQFVVTEAQAHSWVEIYFPGIGWVDFEPTAGRPDIPYQSAPGLEEQAFGSEPLPPLADVHEQHQVGTGWLGYLAVIILVAALGLALWAGIGWLRLRRLSPQDLLGWQYRRLRTYGKRIGLVFPPGVTPLEFSALLAREVQSKGGRDARELDAASELQNLRWFIRVYNRASYSRVPVSRAEKANALRHWPRLALRLWWLGVVMRLRRGFSRG